MHLRNKIKYNWFSTCVYSWGDCTQHVFFKWKEIFFTLSRLQIEIFFVHMNVQKSECQTQLRVHDNKNCRKRFFKVISFDKSFFNPRSAFNSFLLLNSINPLAMRQWMNDKYTHICHHRFYFVWNAIAKGWNFLFCPTYDEWNYHEWGKFIFFSYLRGIRQSFKRKIENNTRSRDSLMEKLN